MTQNGDRVTEEIGFIGLGIMGRPMALISAATGTTLVVRRRCCAGSGRRISWLKRQERRSPR